MSNIYQGRDLIKENVKICSKCIYDETVAGIEFDNKGVCSFCDLIDQLTLDYGTGSKKGELLFNDIVKEIKKSGKRLTQDLGMQHTIIFLAINSNR